MTDMQPIETAPQDSLPVLVFIPIKYEGPATIGNMKHRETWPGTYYVAHFDQGKWWVSHLGLDMHKEVIPPPTHWSPLPAAPVT